MRRRCNHSLSPPSLGLALSLSLVLAVGLSSTPPVYAGYAPGCTVALVVPGSLSHAFHDAAIQADGKIVAVGYVQWPSERDFLVARFHPDLTLDLSFNAPNGFATLDIQNKNIDDEANAVAIQANQKIVVAGYADFNSVKRDMGFARFNRNGSLDPGFGKLSVDFKMSPVDVAYGVAIQPDGKIVAAGMYTPGPSRIAVLRLTKAGGLDLSFTGGSPVLAPATLSDGATDVVIDRQGKIVLAVTADRGATSTDFAVVRLNAVGNLDTTFTGPGTTGWSSIDVGASTVDTTGGMLLQPNDAIVVAGTSNGDLAVARFTPGGPPDGLFGPAVTHDFAMVTAPDQGHDVALDFGGNLVAAGQARFASVDLAVARFFGGGTLDTAFTSDVTPADDIAYAVEVLDSGKILLAGSTGSPGAAVATVALFNPDGSQDCGVPLHPVDVFTATASGDGSGGMVALNWLNPASGLYDETVIRRGAVCPASPSDGVAVAAVADGLGQPGGVVDSGLSIGTTYFYAAFVEDASDNPSPGVCIEATPFDATSAQTEWIYRGGGSILTTPGLRVSPGSGESVAYSVDNNGTVHAIFGGPFAGGGGRWPAGWKPSQLQDAAPDRPIILPLPPTNQLTIVTGAEDGRVYAIDAMTGVLAWKSPPLGATIVGSPAAVLTSFGGARDLIFVGTRMAGVPNRFYALNADDGTVAWFFDNVPGIGMIVSSAVVDYGLDQVYFTSFAGGSGNAVWCLDYTASAPVACSGWGAFGVMAPSGGHVASSPILYKGKLYVSDTPTGDLFAVDPTSGFGSFIMNVGASGVNGYVFPKFWDDTVFASTDTTLFSIDLGGAAIWSDAALPLSAPSTPLHVPGTDQLYVGTDKGKLLSYSATTGPGAGPTVECIGDCLMTTVGSPAFDLFRMMLYVGTGDGEVYGVRAPF